MKEFQLEKGLTPFDSISLEFVVFVPGVLQLVLKRRAEKQKMENFALFILIENPFMDFEVGNIKSK